MILNKPEGFPTSENDSEIKYSILKEYRLAGLWKLAQ
jgi:hypothetical protein